MSQLEHMPPPRTIWMRYTDNDGGSHVMEHIVWDKDLFLSRRADEAANEARNKPNGKARAEQISEDDYRRER